MGHMKWVSGMAAIATAGLALATPAAKPDVRETPIAATAVTVRAESLKDALAALQQSQKTASPFDEGKVFVVDLRSRDGQGNEPIAVRVDFQNKPFWQAADELAAAARMRLVPYWETIAGHPQRSHAAAGFLLADPRRPQTSPRVDYCGPFRIELHQAAIARDARNEPLPLVAIDLSLAAEPRYQPILFRIRRDSIRIRGADGEPEAVNQGGTGEVRMLGQQPTHLRIRVPLPEKGRTLPLLEGDLTVLLPPEFAVFEFPSLDGKPEARSRDGVVVQAAVVERNLKTWTVRITLRYPPPDKASGFDLESHQTWVLEHNVLQLKSRQGNRTLDFKGNPVITVAEGQTAHVDYTFADVDGEPKDWKAVYASPANPIKFPLKFRFTDVPISTE